MGWHEPKNYRVQTQAGINNGYWGVYVNGVMVDQFWLNPADWLPVRGEGRANGLQNDLRARFMYAQCLDRGSWSNFRTTGAYGHLISPTEGGNTYFEWQGGADWSYYCIYNINYPH